MGGRRLLLETRDPLRQALIPLLGLKQLTLRGLPGGGSLGDTLLSGGHSLGGHHPLVEQLAPLLQFLARHGQRVLDLARRGHGVADHLRGQGGLFAQLRLLALVGHEVKVDLRRW